MASGSLRRWAWGCRPPPQHAGVSGLVVSAVTARGAETLPAPQHLSHRLRRQCGPRDSGRSRGTTTALEPRASPEFEDRETERCLLLPVVREYAEHRLQAEYTEDVTALQQRYVSYFVQLASNNANINIPEQNALLHAEWRNALHAAEIAGQIDDWNALKPLAYSLRVFLELSIYGAEATQLQQTALRAAIHVDDVQGQANCIFSLGRNALRRSDHDCAPILFEQAHRLYRKTSDVLGQANCLSSHGDIAFARSDHAGARTLYKQAQSLYQNIGDLLGQANCILSLGSIALARSDHDTVRQCYTEAQPLFQQAGDVLGQANCILSLGDIALARSDYALAHTLFEQAQLLFQQLGDVQGQANCRFSLGEIALRHLDYSLAHTLFEQAQPLFHQVGDVQGQANCISSLGVIALGRSNHT